MSNRSGAVHVATTMRIYKGKTYTTHLLRRTYREGQSVKHETLGNLSHLPVEAIQMIRDYLRGEKFVKAQEAFEIERSLPHGHVAAALGTLYRVGLDRIISSKPSVERDLVVAMIVSRIIAPSSKLATARGLAQETQLSSLGQVLGLDKTSEDDLYSAMDWLVQRQDNIEKALASRQLKEGSLVLYDVTSSYFEGRKCCLAHHGHSRDGQKEKLQIVYGLLCDEGGCPVAVEVFDGNTADPKTFSAQVEKVRTKFKLTRVVMVGDRGMITDARIREDLAGTKGLDWITALRSGTIQKLVECGTLQLSLFDQKDMAEITHPDYPGERFIACRNPLLAAERKRKREELLQCTEQKLQGIADATRRPKRKLKGKDKIGLRVGRVIQQYKMQKHFTLDIQEDAFSFTRDQAGIDTEAAVDGIYVVRTSVPATKLDAQKVVAAYKNLSCVERAFRSLKTVDLKIRPINHYLEKRVRSHVFLCMLAYYIEWHMRQALAPMLFDDDDKATAKALRQSVVAPAVRSHKAAQKASTKKTIDGLVVHSFQTLLKDLATLNKNRLRTPSATDTFEMFTTPTPLQQRAFALLGLSHKL